MTLLVAQAGLVLLAVVLVATAIPFRARRVPPNATFGLRTGATLADERVWYEANARSAMGAIVLAVATVLAAIALPLVPAVRALGPTPAALLLVGVFVAGAAVHVAWSASVARRLLRERHDTDAGSARAAR